jgi:Ca2+-binding RTX toxin-like protein
MSRSNFDQWTNKLFRLQGTRKTRKPNRTLSFEPLDNRIMPAITAVFAAGQLTITGDAQSNTIVVSRNAAGSLLVNGGAVSVQGGTPTVANVATVQVFGLAGNDTISLDETNGALPKAILHGGDGNDTLTGGSGDDLLFGEAGNDTLLGKGGIDQLFGGAGNDVLTGGTANDQVFGEAGDDRMIWNPGEGSDINEGGDGNDTVEVNGGNGAETFTVTANGTRVRFDRTTPAPFNIDIGTTENLVLNANGGDDVITAGNGLAGLIQLSLDGGTGNDTITGGDGNDLINGGDGNDMINGGRGNDRVFMGTGDDTFVWNPGDGSDVVEGQAGNDTMIFNGANVNENMNLSANGHRLRFTRDVGTVSMDVDGTENININAAGGADNLTFNDLSATAVTHVNLDLGAGDAQADTVTVTGTNAADNVQIRGSGSSFTVAGLSTLFNVTNSEGNLDQLAVNLLGGNDIFTAVALPAGVTNLTVDGGAGNDNFIGSDGADKLLGGDGNDTITGGKGNDVALMGSGNDTFIWNPGDGSDTIEGQAGNDTMLFNGANVNEKIDISANGQRLRFFRDIANITMDADGVENVTFNALGGTDTVTVNDLTGTAVTNVNLNLAATTGVADAETDSVIVNGTSRNDRIIVSGSPASGVKVAGLAATINISKPDATDNLTINALAGADTIDASSLQAGVISLTENGGDNDDVLIGSRGNDLINGGTGNDRASMGDGDDTFVWNPGDGSDTIEGQGGNDTMLFNGADGNENMVMSANGRRLRFVRDVGSVTMDVDGVEDVNVNAKGGADTITVNNLAGTAVKHVNLNLAASDGNGDGQADTVVVNGTDGSDALAVFGDSTGTTVAGLAATVRITGAEAANDKLAVNTLGGDDVVGASGLAAGAILLAVDGGNGADVLIGGAGNDTLTGGAGDDVLIGGPGQDILDGGPGNNIVIQ